MKVGLRGIFREAGSNELLAGEIREVSPSGRFICLEYRWYKETGLVLIEELAPAKPWPAAVAAEDPSANTEG